MRLIDADELKRCVESFAGLISYDCFMVNHAAVMMAIDTAPTVEAESVRHGTWIYRYAVIDGVKKSSKLFCGECGEQCDDESEYCKYCGAKMDAGYEHYDIDMTEEDW